MTVNSLFVLLLTLFCSIFGSVDHTSYHISFQNSQFWQEVWCFRLIANQIILFPLMPCNQYVYCLGRTLEGAVFGNWKHSRQVFRWQLSTKCRCGRDIQSFSLCLYLEYDCWHITVNHTLSVTSFKALIVDFNNIIIWVRISSHPPTFCNGWAERVWIQC